MSSRYLNTERHGSAAMDATERAKLVRRAKRAFMDPTLKKSEWIERYKRVGREALDLLTPEERRQGEAARKALWGATPTQRERDEI